MSGHTGAGVPLLFRDMLNEIAPIDEDAVDSYGAREAVEKLQSRCKWDQGAFGEPTCLRVSDAYPKSTALWALGQ